MEQHKSPHRYRIIKASKRLQQKIGIGTIGQDVIEAGQTAIDGNDVDFVPLGLEILQRLKAGLAQISKTSVALQDKNTRLCLIAPIMELKANASTFGYTLVGSMANIILSFLENIERIDEDAQGIVRAYHDILHTLLMNGVSGDGGAHKDTMVRELQEACARYHKKNY